MGFDWTRRAICIITAAVILPAVGLKAAPEATLS